MTFAVRVRHTLFAAAAIASTALTVSTQRGAAAARATTIVGADLADGTGAALRRANVRSVGDRIVAVGTVTPQRGDSVAAGRRESNGSFGWDGAFGTHFWVDRKEQLVGLLMIQEPVAAMGRDFENAVMQAIVE